MSDEDNIKIEINLIDKCTCCLINDGWRFMWKSYEHNESNEVYGKMIMDCFILSLDVRNQDMICEPCVVRLREAVKLKIEFVAVQELLQENFISMEKKNDVKIEKEFTNEVSEQNLEIPDTNEHDTEDRNILSESESISNEQPKRKPVKYTRTYKNYSLDDLQNAKRAILKKEMTVSKAAEMYGIPIKTLTLKLTSNTEEKDKERFAVHEKNLKLYEEISTIIRFTNAIPFKIKTTKYYCAYCPLEKHFFEDPEKLRDHTTSVHRFELVKLVQQIMRPAWLNEIIRMEITNLKCNMCDLPLRDWNRMFAHFDETHDIVFDEAYTRVIPFSLTDDLQCVLCGKSFLNFGMLDVHMNAHYCNYICYECGDPFLASSRLEKHLKIHKVGRYPCNVCNRIFSLELYRSKHIKLVHEHLAQVKCLYCPEKFLAMSKRHQHMLQRHPDKVTFTTCEYCGKKFTLKKSYFDHLMMEHPKTYTCAKCKKTFPSKDEVRKHWNERVRMNDLDHTGCEIHASSIRPVESME